MAVIVTALMLAYLRTEHHNAASHENQQDLKLQYDLQKSDDPVSSETFELIERLEMITITDHAECAGRAGCTGQLGAFFYFCVCLKTLSFFSIGIWFSNETWQKCNGIFSGSGCKIGCFHLGFFGCLRQCR